MKKYKILSLGLLFLIFSGGALAYTLPAAPWENTASWEALSFAQRITATKSWVTTNIGQRNSLVEAPWVSNSNYNGSTDSHQAEKEWQHLARHSYKEKYVNLNDISIPDPSPNNDEYLINFNPEKDYFVPMKTSNEWTNMRTRILDGEYEDLMIFDGDIVVVPGKDYDPDDETTVDHLLIDNGHCVFQGSGADSFNKNNEANGNNIVVGDGDENPQVWGGNARLGSASCAINFPVGGVYRLSLLTQNSLDSPMKPGASGIKRCTSHDTVYVDYELGTNNWVGVTSDTVSGYPYGSVNILNKGTLQLSKPEWNQESIYGGILNVPCDTKAWRHLWNFHSSKKDIPYDISDGFAPVGLTDYISTIKVSENQSLRVRISGREPWTKVFKFKFTLISGTEDL